MATKTISVDLEAYRRLKSVQKENESFSQTIKRVIRKPVDLESLFARLARDPLSPEAVAAVEQQIAQWCRCATAGLMTLLDTSVLIDVAKGGRSPESRRAQGELLTRLRAGQTLFTSRLNEAEFRVGEFRSADPAREAAKIDAVLATIVILEFDAPAARTFARLKAAALSLGKFPGDMDLLIAAVAMANGEPVLTRNPRHFSHIPGLVVESY